MAAPFPNSFLNLSDFASDLATLSEVGREGSENGTAKEPAPKRAKVTVGAILDFDDRRNDGTLAESEGKTTWQNWGSSVGPVRLARAPVWPKTKSDVKKIIAELAATPPPRPRLRVAGHAHSWTPIVCADDELLIFCRDFRFDDGGRIKLLDPHPDGSPLVRVCAGVRTGELVEWMETFFSKPNSYPGQYPGLSQDAVLDNVRYSGLIACGCHGTGWNVQTVSDFVHSMTVINYKGEEVVYDASHPDFNAAKCSFGLLGVTYDLVLKLDNNKDAPLVEVTHQKLKQREVFADTPESRQALKSLVESHYAVEMLWFPLNTFPVISFKPKRWDPLGDEVWIKLFQRAKVPSNGVQTVSFTDPFHTLQEWLKVNFGTNIKKLLEAFAVQSKKPAISALFGNFAHDQQEDEGPPVVTTLPRAIHWQKSVDDVHVNDLEFCFKVDPDFSNVHEAWRTVIQIMDKWINEYRENPLNIACEWRFTAHSDAIMSPAYGQPGDHFCWIEVLSLVGTPSWEKFAAEVATAWKAIGGVRPKPHWAKWNASRVAGKNDIVTDYAKDVYASQIAEFAKVVKRADPDGMFQTQWLTDTFGLK